MNENKNDLTLEWFKKSKEIQNRFHQQLEQQRTYEKMKNEIKQELLKEFGIEIKNEALPEIKELKKSIQNLFGN